MNPPPVHVRLLGSRPFVLGSTASTLLLGAGSLEVPNLWFFAALSLGVALAAAKAEPAAQAYQRWRRDWAALGGDGTRRKRGSSIPIFVGMGLAALYLASPPDGRSALLTVGLLIACVVAVGYGLVRLARRRPHRGTRDIEPVAVCIAAPIYSVPSLQEAFGALPEHCHRHATRQP